VRAAGAGHEHSEHESWATPHPPASASVPGQSAQAALA
jgi:hypothetical protein